MCNLFTAVRSYINSVDLLLRTLLANFEARLKITYWKLCLRKSTILNTIFVLWSPSEFGGLERRYLRLINHLNIEYSDSVQLELVIRDRSTLR